VPLSFIARNAAMRIVSLLSSATEIVCELGLADQLLAVSHECDFPDAMRDKPRSTFSNVDSLRSSLSIDDQVKSLLAENRPLYEIEKALVRDLRPDLLITQSQCDVCAIKYTDVLDFVAASPELRFTQVLSLNPASLDEVFADVLRIGAAAGAQTAAAKKVADYQTRVNAVRAKTTTLSPHERPRVACIEWTEPLMIAGNWTPQLLAWAGAKIDLTGFDELSSPGDHSRYITWDELLRYDPDVVIMAPCGFDLPRTLQEAQTLTHRSEWKQLSAVRNNRVFAVDGNAYLNRSGPRLVESLEIVAHLLHPQLIPAPQSLLSSLHDFCKLCADEA
jgi:iron complex transport system substrate-binding protein